MESAALVQSTKDSTYAEFAKGRFDIVSGSKLSRIVAHTGQSILDVGCGPGAYISALRARGYQVDGVEGNALMAVEAQKTGASIYQLDLDIDGLSPIGDNSYDTVICLDVLEHLQRPLETLRELSRVARNNVIVSVPAETPAALAKGGCVYAAYVDPTHLRYYTTRGLRQDLIDVDLHNIEIYPTFSIQPVMLHLFPQKLHRLMRLLNYILLHLITPESNWSVLLGVGHKIPQ